MTLYTLIGQLKSFLLMLFLLWFMQYVGEHKVWIKNICEILGFCFFLQSASCAVYMNLEREKKNDMHCTCNLLIVSLQGGVHQFSSRSWTLSNEEKRAWKRDPKGPLSLLTELGSSYRPETCFFEILLSRRISMTLEENCWTLKGRHVKIYQYFFFFMTKR